MLFPVTADAASFAVVTFDCKILSVVTALLASIGAVTEAASN